MQDADCNIGNAFREIARARGDRTALVIPGRKGYRSYTFHELERQCIRYGAALKCHGLGPGDRVMLMVKPSPEFLCLTFALFRLGCIVILIDPGMGYKNLLTCIGGVRPDVLIGIPKAQLFSRLFPKVFRTVKRRICVGRSFGLLGVSLSRLCKRSPVNFASFVAGPDDPAAIIFTTGSTGPPKGVHYTHGVFRAQLRLIRDYYGIRPGDVDQPCFPLFALFSAALGATSVIPAMNPAKPAQVDPAKFVKSLRENQVTYSFGSPAIWKVVSRYCIERRLSLPIRKVLMAGAPVPGELIERMRQIMPPDGEIHTPYGATECLPISSISGQEVVEETLALSRQGKGTCVGRPLPEIDIRIIEPVEGVIADWQEVNLLPADSIGEIVVRGDVVTDSYDSNPQETELSKIRDHDSFWHRIGDMGYFDEQGRLWFCGRKAHRVFTDQGVLLTIPCESLFNEHPAVARSALVGIGPVGRQRPVLVVEPVGKVRDEQALFSELTAIARNHQITQTIRTFLVHPFFPVDIRHNAKIFREKLAAWAAESLGSGTEFRESAPDTMQADNGNA